jgi:hypothetical protein
MCSIYVAVYKLVQYIRVIENMDSLYKRKATKLKMSRGDVHERSSK